MKKSLLLVCATLMIALGLTGIFWPEGLMDLARYSFTKSGAYFVAAVRILLGTFLFTCADTARTPKTFRVIGGVILTAGIVGFLLGNEPARRMSEWWVARGPDAFRMVACVPLAIGLFIAGSTLAKSSSR